MSSSPTSPARPNLSSSTLNSRPKTCRSITVSSDCASHLQRGGSQLPVPAAHAAVAAELLSASQHLAPKERVHAVLPGDVELISSDLAGGIAEQIESLLQPVFLHELPDRPASPFVDRGDARQWAAVFIPHVHELLVRDCWCPLFPPLGGKGGFFLQWDYLHGITFGGMWCRGGRHVMPGWGGIRCRGGGGMWCRASCFRPPFPVPLMRQRVHGGFTLPLRPGNKSLSFKCTERLPGLPFTHAAPGRHVCDALMRHAALTGAPYEAAVNAELVWVEAEVVQLRVDEHQVYLPVVLGLHPSHVSSFLTRRLSLVSACCSISCARTNWCCSASALLRRSRASLSRWRASILSRHVRHVWPAGRRRLPRAWRCSSWQWSDSARAVQRVTERAASTYSVMRRSAVMTVPRTGWVGSVLAANPARSELPGGNGHCDAARSAPGCRRGE